MNAMRSLDIIRSSGTTQHSSSESHFHQYDSQHFRYRFTFSTEVMSQWWNRNRYTAIHAG